MNSGVYQLRSTVTGERYIGSSTQLNTRRGEHLRFLRAGSHRIARLQELVTTHGIDSIVFEVIETCEPGETLAREQVWIRAATPELNKHQAGRSGAGRPPTFREAIHVSLPRGMSDALKNAAAERGWDRSRLLEELARAFLKEQAEAAEATESPPAATLTAAPVPATTPT